MSSRSKGMKREREYELLLQDRGYITYRVKGSTVWAREVDIFNLFDIIALRKGKWLLVQVKSRYDGSVAEAIRKWKEINSPAGTTCMLVVWQKGNIRQRWREVIT